MSATLIGRHSVRIARSTFIIGAHEFEVPSLHPAVLDEIREFGRTIDRALPNVERIVMVAAIAAMLTPTYPWVTAHWLSTNLDAETAAGLIENLTAQTEMAIAAWKAPAPAAEAGLPH